jgi:hypothetical protein
MLIGIVCLILLAVVVGFYLGSRGSGGEQPSAGGEQPSASTPRTTEVVEPASVTAFDPDGDGPLTDENADEVPLATDGDPSTAWETLGYDDGPALAPYKSGVGLLLDLGQERPVSEVRVTLDGAPYDLSLLATPESSGAPTDVDGLTKVDSVTGASGTVTLSGSDPVTTRYLVVWLTALPRSSEDGRYRGSVAEVVVRS